MARGKCLRRRASFSHTGQCPVSSGDAFAAGYIYAFLDGQLYCEQREVRAATALTFGNGLTALKRCIAGDIAIITPQEVRDLLEKREGSKRFR